MKTTGEILDTIVEALGINYVDLARTLGMNRPNLFYNMRSGKSNPSYETLQAIVKAYPQIDCRFLLTGEGEPLLKPAEPPKDALKDYIRSVVTELLEEKQTPSH